MPTICLASFSKHSGQTKSGTTKAQMYKTQLDSRLKLHTLSFHQISKDARMSIIVEVGAHSQASLALPQVDID